MFLYGLPLANKITGELKSKKIPSGRFVVIQVGSDPTSSLYIEKKAEMARQLGIGFDIVRLEASILQEDFKKKIEELNLDGSVRAILIQIPLPKQLDRLSAASFIDPAKDVDGFNYIVGKSNHPIPPTVMAIVDLLSFYNIKLAGKSVLIVGGGFLVGKPLYRYLSQQNIDVEVLRKDDANYRQKLRDADVVITATGRGANFSYADFKVGATVIDASTVFEGGSTKGDVEIDGWQNDKNIAPVPGGVGPVTVAELFKNFLLLG